MVELLKTLQQRIALIANDTKTHLANDREFAYAAGQVIYYLLSLSEAGNKTHGILEPFLQKSNCETFKMAIARTFAQYKHAIPFAYSKFNNLTAQILSYETPVDMKKLLPMVLAGYFAKNIMYQKKNVSEDLQEEESVHE